MRTSPTAADWKALNFRCGLEIHHQLLTEKKLFCHCPAGHYSDVYHAEVLRHMRPTLSELGEYDGTALMEFKTKKEIIYRLNRDTVCTYEMDDNPPFLVNDQAVDIALTIALALKCKIVGELHIIRKQYLDGSIPAGFQRTAIVGVDGEITLSSGKRIGIIQLGLEEDACREVADVGHRIIFMADRLSMPIIEVVTESNLNTPEEAGEAAERIRRLLRATQLVRRGMGAGRQDVNVSIEGSTRVEIKGVPRIPRIPALTALEALRQKALLDIRTILQERGYNPGDAPGEMVTVTAEETFNRPELAAALTAGDTVRVVRLPRADGILKHPLSGGRSFADDIAGRVRVIACLDQQPNLLHTDGKQGGLDTHDQKLLRKIAGCEQGDVAVVVWGEDEDTVTACKEIIARFAEAIDGVPNETRQALSHNATDFERVLPGPDRMYPDTDSPPTMITDERVERARALVPELPWDREARYLAQGLSPDMAARLSISRHAPLFDRLMVAGAVSPMRAAEVLTRMLVALRREDVDIANLTDQHLETALRALGKGDIHREGLLDLLATWSAEPDLTFEELRGVLGWFPLEEGDVAQEIGRAMEAVKELEPRHPDNVPALTMGLVMSRLAGRVAASEVLQQMNGHS